LQILDRTVIRNHIALATSLKSLRRYAGFTLDKHVACILIVWTRHYSSIYLWGFPQRVELSALRSCDRTADRWRIDILTTLRPRLCGASSSETIL